MPPPTQGRSHQAEYQFYRLLQRNGLNPAMFWADGGDGLGNPNAAE